MTGAFSCSRRSHDPGRGNIRKTNAMPALDATRGSVKGGAAMSRTEALPAKWISPIDPGISTIPLLIQVPRYSSHPVRGKPHLQAHAMSMSPGGRTRRRRRLRREVRLTGYTVLAMVPLLLALWSWPVNRPIRLSGAHLLSIPYPSGELRGLPVQGDTELWASAEALRPVPPVLLSVEPFGTNGDADGETPVVFPGYLLPDDTREEPAHEGS